MDNSEKLATLGAQDTRVWIHTMFRGSNIHHKITVNNRCEA